jgi:hypothetical protein
MTSAMQTERAKALALRWNMTPEALEHAACVWALIFRDSAPRAVQTLFSGRPSFYAENAKLLALAFFLIYTEAVDRLTALGTADPVDASECWRIALKLVGGAA